MAFTRSLKNERSIVPSASSSSPMSPVHGKGMRRTTSSALTARSLPSSETSLSEATGTRSVNGVTMAISLSVTWAARPTRRSSM